MKTNAKREMYYTKVSASIVKETEKAYQVEVLYWTQFDKPVKKAVMWCPKSCAKTEDGKVTEIADFILKRWDEEHRQTVGIHCSYAAKKMRIEWDIEWKERLMKEEADKQAAYKKHFDDTIAKYLPTAKEESHKWLNTLGMIAKAFGRIWKEEGTDAAACDEFIAWGEAVCKKYGDKRSDEDYYDLVKAYDGKERQLVVANVYNVWILGDFHASYYGEGHDFYEVKEYLLKNKFKKERAIVDEYKEFINKLYQLNGNRY